MMYNRPNMPEMPQANSYDYSTVSPQLAQLITMLSKNQNAMPMIAGRKGGLAGLEGTAIDPTQPAQKTKLPSGMITNEMLPNQSATQPSRLHDPNYQWGSDNKGNSYWKPKGSNSEWIPYRGE